MPKRNYRFEKHQKDLAKQKRKQEKLLRKQERASRPEDELTGEPTPVEDGGEPPPS